MDTTTIIVIVAALVVIIALRLAIRSYRLRQTSGKRPPEEGATFQVEPSDADDTAAPAVEAQQPDATPAREETASVQLAPSKDDIELDIAVEASRLFKSFGGREVVKDVSFALAQGEVFGLVGPNGAGKTTTIRMLMDIIRPDSGDIRLFGQPIDESTKDRIGYLPEERGLYRRMRVSDTIVYLASLKSVGAHAAKQRAEELLKQADMFPHEGKKVSELSRGMAQIIQFLVTIAHQPDLIVLDEPFAGLDPVNRQLLKDIVLQLRKEGRTIVLSTHMMNEVEEMCDRIMMIDRGRAVLYGKLDEIRWRYRNNSVFVQCDGDIGELEGVTGKRMHGKYVELFLEGDSPPQRILSQLVERNIRVNRFEVSTPSLNEIFIQVVQNRQ